MESFQSRIEAREARKKALIAGEKLTAEDRKVVAEEDAAIERYQKKRDNDEFHRKRLELQAKIDNCPARIRDSKKHCDDELKKARVKLEQEHNDRLASITKSSNNAKVELRKLKERVEGRTQVRHIIFSIGSSLANMRRGRTAMEVHHSLQV